MKITKIAVENYQGIRRFQRRREVQRCLYLVGQMETVNKTWVCVVRK